MHSDIKVDCINQICPMPLVETRKALRKAKEGQVVEVIGTHPASKKEIPMAVKSLGFKLLKIEEREKGVWRIFIKKIREEEE